MLVKTMFPGKPESYAIQGNRNYPEQLPMYSKITHKQIKRHLDKLSPYKATSTNEIPNIILNKCADILIPYLIQIFRATFKLRIYTGKWQEIITCVLRKPGKPRYDLLKAYHPIALLNTIAKLLSSIVAEEITYIAKTHMLLPDTHFGGRPGRTTSDSLHLLMDTIKAAWCKKQVVSVLFLDIEGAFPNAVTERLLHNMRKRRIPEEYVFFMKNMLAGCKTRLKFDNYMSDWFAIDNSIGQGNPLSMILYLFYNVDLLNIAKGMNKKSLGYMDNKALIAIGKKFTETHRLLKRMMERRNRGFTWSESHNSRFKLTKLILMDFIHSKTAEHPPLILHSRIFTPQQTHKFIGVSMDQELQWNHQADHAIAKAMKWTMAFHRLV
jgi:hypothetical protein